MLLLVGSPKSGRSTSQSLGGCFLEKLKEKGFETGSISVYPLLRSAGGMRELKEAVDTADVVVISFPLYVDSLPAGLIRALEGIAMHRKNSDSPRKQKLVVISNSGFPESQHMDTAIAICREFARETGMEWLGGLSLGGGASIDGKPLAKAGGMVRNVISALELAASDIAEGKPLSDETLSVMARPMMPSWTYTFFGNLGWLIRANKFGVLWKLKDRPYSRE